MNALIEKKKRLFYNSKFQDVTSCKELYNIANEVIGKPTEKTLPSNKSVQDLCNDFSKSFEDKINLIRQDLDQLSSEHPTYELFNGDPLHDFAPTTETEVLHIISSSPLKSCDLDSLPTNILKECLDFIVPVITKIFNDSLCSGFVPNSFKTALITALLKKEGPGEDLSKYRPISNFSFLSKVLERIVLKRLLTHVAKNEIGEIHQSAYIKRTIVQKQHC